MGYVPPKYDGLASILFSRGQSDICHKQLTTIDKLKVSRIDVPVKEFLEMGLVECIG